MATKAGSTVAPIRMSPHSNSLGPVEAAPALELLGPVEATLFENRSLWF